MEVRRTQAEEVKAIEELRSKIARGEGKDRDYSFDPDYGITWYPSDEENLKVLEQRLADNSRWVLRPGV